MLKHRFLLLLLLLTPLFFVPFPTEANNVFWGPFFDAGHFPLFFIVTALIFRLPPASLAPKRTRVLAAVTGSTVLATAVEFIQPLFGRSASSGDMLFGFCGALAAGGLFLTWQEKPARYLILLLAAAGQSALLYPAWEGLQAAIWREKHFPLLADFKNSSQMPLWEILAWRGGNASLSIEHAYSPARPVLSVTIQGGAWSGVKLDAGEKDWRPFASLAFEANNPSESPLELYLRIDDRRDAPRYAERFNTVRVLEPGWNSIEIPVSDIKQGVSEGTFDIRHVKWVYFFVKHGGKGKSFNLADIRLVPGPR